MANIICEQGDMGLWNTPLNEQDEKLLREQQEKETERNKDKGATKSESQ